MLRERAIAGFQARWGTAPTHLAVAPGRVNLIGEHTDYQDGYVFPAAIDRYLVAAIGLAPERSELVSESNHEPSIFHTSAPESSDLPNWGKYPAGIAWALSEHTQADLPNLRAFIVADLPLGAGLSSSAAIEMAFATAWNEIAGLGLPNGVLAKLGQLAENEFVGMKCGIMDQTASLFGLAGHALRIDTTDAANPIPVPIPDDLALLVCDTCVKHELAGSAYNERRAEVAEAARILGVSTLRHATLDQLEARQSEMRPVVARRAHHIISENLRVLAFDHALASRDDAEIGRLMAESHESLCTDYEVSCHELDAMAEEARALPGCIGARMTGAGFGGSVIALVHQAQAADFANQIAQRYTERTGKAGQIHLCHAADGASTVQL